MYKVIAASLFLFLAFVPNAQAEDWVYFDEISSESSGQFTTGNHIRIDLFPGSLSEYDPGTIGVLFTDKEPVRMDLASSSPGCNQLDYIVGCGGIAGTQPAEWPESVRLNYGAVGLSLPGWWYVVWYFAEPPSYINQAIGYTAVYLDGSGNPSSPPEYEATTTTRILTIEPLDKAVVASSSSFEFSATGQVSELDYKIGLLLRFEFWNDTESQVVVSPSVLAVTLETPILSPGFFNKTIIHDFSGAAEGKYYLKTHVVKPRLFGLFDDVLVASSTTFTIATSTAWDRLNQDILEHVLASGVDSCEWNWTSPFDLWGCVIQVTRAMFVPNAPEIAGLIEQFRQSFLKKAPMGYVTRFYDVLTADIATSSLPSVVFTVPNGFPMQGASLDLTPWGHLAGPTSIFANATSAGSSTPFLQNMAPYWEFMWWLVFAFWLVSEVLRASNAGDFTSKDESL